MSVIQSKLKQYLNSSISTIWLHTSAFDKPCVQSEIYSWSNVHFVNNLCALTIQRFNLFTRYRGATYADAVAITQCLAFWRYAVELQRTFLEPLSYVSQSSFLALVELYNLILTNRYSGLRAVNLHPSLLLDSLQLAIDNVER